MSGRGRRRGRYPAAAACAGRRRTVERGGARTSRTRHRHADRRDDPTAIRRHRPMPYAQAVADPRHRPVRLQAPSTQFANRRRRLSPAANLRRPPALRPATASRIAHRPIPPAATPRSRRRTGRGRPARVRRRPGNAAATATSPPAARVRRSVGRGPPGRGGSCPQHGRTGGRPVSARFWRRCRKTPRSSAMGARPDRAATRIRIDASGVRVSLKQVPRPSRICRRRGDGAASLSPHQAPQPLCMTSRQTAESVLRKAPA